MNRAPEFHPCKSVVPLLAESQRVFLLIEDYGKLNPNMCDTYAKHAKEKEGARPAQPLDPLLFEHLCGVTALPLVMIHVYNTCLFRQA